ncbi:uncharacterized protein LOC124253206 [Haliotis rubra]|uniref:uncharacterized protein LOC124253206 n=1 Tax=Haliotis rubra TaxID=36100 RepID=UPI001EE5EB90|nr:uncharacterized protein LOC124253206 [Haliotis rubra]
MVLYININVGQRVEVLIGGGIYRGTIQYKGCIITKNGEWVGVALDDPVGDNCGMILGRRYFQCRDKYGIFVRASKIRFISSGRRLFNKYHRVIDDDAVEENLFHTEKPAVTNGPYDPVRMSSEDFSRVRSSLGFSLDQIFPHCPTRRHHNLSHAVGNKIPAITMLRPSTSMASFRYHTQPIHTSYSIENDFIPSPSIPKTHMPYTALRRQVRRGWDNAHYVREMSVPSGRERMKMSQWNDISE